MGPAERALEAIGRAQREETMRENPHQDSKPCVCVRCGRPMSWNAHIESTICPGCRSQISNG